MPTPEEVRLARLKNDPAFASSEYAKQRLTPEEMAAIGLPAPVPNTVAAQPQPPPIEGPPMPAWRAPMLLPETPKDSHAPPPVPLPKARDVVAGVAKEAAAPAGQLERFAPWRDPIGQPSQALRDVYQGAQLLYDRFGNAIGEAASGANVPISRSPDHPDIIAIQRDQERINQDLMRRGLLAPESIRRPPEQGDATPTVPASKPSPAQAFAQGAGVGAAMGPQEMWRLGPTQREAFDLAFKAETNAALDNSARTREVYDQQKAFWDKESAAQQAALDANKELEARRQSELNRAAMLYADVAAEASTRKIDPDRYWNSKSTGSKIMAGLGIILGGFAQGALKGGPNAAMQVIDKAIDRDIEAQKAAIEQGNKSVDHAKSLYGMVLQKIGDSRQADQVARAAALDKIAIDAKAMAAGMSGNEVQNQLNTLLAAIAQKRAQYLAQAMAYVTPAGSGGAGPINLAGGEADVNPDHIVHIGGGKYVDARDRENANKLRAGLSYYKAVDAGLSEMASLEHRANYLDKINPASEYNQRRRAIAQTIVTLGNVAAGQGAITGHDQERTQQMLAIGQGINRFTDNTRAIEQARTLNERTALGKLWVIGGDVLVKGKDEPVKVKGGGVKIRETFIRTGRNTAELESEFAPQGSVRVPEKPVR